MAKFVGSLNVPTISTAPLSASEGDVYYDTTADDLLFYVNSSWTPVGTIQNISAGAGISVSGSGDSRQVSLESVASSSSSGTPGTSFVKSLSSDVYGRVISYESGSVQNASTTAAGIVQLSDSISTTSSALAATPTAVKSAYDIASGKASKSGDTFTGPIVITGGDSQTNTDTASLNAIGYNQRGGTGYHGFLDIRNTFGSATNPKKFFRINSTGAIEIINSAYTTNIFTLSDAGNLSVPSLSANDYVSIPSWNQAGAGRVGTASTVTVTTAGTYYAIGGSDCEVSFTPDFVGQKFFVTMTGYASLNTTTIQYAFVRVTLTDSSNVSQADLNFSRSENFGTSGRGGTVASSLVWTADTTSARKIKLYGTSQTTNGLVLTLAYWQINVMALA
jgi:hypothetical protein